MIHLTPEEVLAFVGGMFIYGLKSYVGKWMVQISIKLSNWFVRLTFKIGRKYILRTEEDLQLFIAYYHAEQDRLKSQRHK